MLPFCMVIYFYFFLPVPDFYSVNLKKKISQNDAVIKWMKVEGILDQDFPDYITIQKGKKIDTICKAHNIADIKLNKDSNYLLIIGFYGHPESYGKAIVIPKKILNYEIEIDTNYVK
jgi:hypothetical protein